MSLRRNFRLTVGVAAMVGDRERCLAAGMDGYVSKPLNPKDLFTAIEEFVRPES